MFYIIKFKHFITVSVFIKGGFVVLFKGALSAR